MNSPLRAISRPCVAALTLLLAACGSTTSAPASQAPASKPAASASAGAPAGSAAAKPSAPAASPSAPTSPSTPAAKPSAASQQSQPLKRAELSFTTLSPVDVVWWVAFETKQWPKYGMDVTINFQEGAELVAQALMSGSLKYGSDSGPTIANANAAGGDLVLLSSDADTVTDILVTQANIKAAQDLKGKKVAISTFGSEGDYTMVRALEAMGLNPDKDVTRLQVGQESSRLAALRAGTVAAGMLELGQEPDAKALGLNVLVRLKDLNLKFQKSGLVTTKSYLSKNHDEALNMLKGQVAAFRVMKDPAQEKTVKDVIAKYMKGAKQETIDATYNEATTVIGRKPSPTVPGMQAIIDQLSIKDPSIKTKVKAETSVDSSLLDELDKSGFITDLYKDCPNCKQ